MATGSQNNTSFQAQKWTNLRAFTVGDTAKNVDGTTAVSWSKDEILGASTSAYFLRGDKEWSNILTGTLNLQPASGEGGELHLCASTANVTEAGIVLDHYGNSLRIFGIASADGTTKTGTGTPLVINPYDKTITGGYTITGALIGHASNDLALTGGEMAGTARITWADSGSWGKSDATFPNKRGGLYWSGTSDWIDLFAEETSSDKLNLVINFGDDTNPSLVLRNKGTDAITLTAGSGNITAATFTGSGASLTSLNASNISSGTIALAHLPMGNANTALIGKGSSTAPAYISISPSISITAGTADNAPKINLTVLGVSGTTAQELTKATTGVYGTTKLSSAVNSSSEVLAATPKAVKAAYDQATTALNTANNLLATADALVFKGTLGTGGTVTAVPTSGYQAGWTYKIITAGTWAGQVCEEGDLLIAIVDAENSQTAVNNAHWTVVQENINGYIHYFNNHDNNIDALISTPYLQTAALNGGGWNGTKPSGSHNGLAVFNFQTHVGNYYTQLALDTNQNRLWLRSANNVTAFGNWAKIATVADIEALDANLNSTTPGAGKTLTAFSQTNGKVSATFGNISITKSQVSDFAHNHDGTYSYIHLTDYSFTTTKPLSKYVTFDKSSPDGAPTASWYNGFISSHNNYLASYIINAHRTANWYVGYGQFDNSTNTAPAPTWYLLAHSGNVGTGDNNGQVKIAGQNVSVKGLAALAYKASLSYSDVGAAPAITGGYLPLSGGEMTGRIYREGVSTSWHKGRNNALVATSTLNGYSPFASIKTNNGSWDIGAYNNSSYTDDLIFSYVTDTQYSGSSAVTTAQIKFLENGHIVAALDGNATTATTATTATGANRLNSLGRITNADQAYGDGHVRAWLASSTMTTGKPPSDVREDGSDSNSDAVMLDLPWDGNTWGGQLAINLRSGALFSRSRVSGTFNNWKLTLNDYNYTKYTVTKTGGGASGTWGISITGNAGTATKLQTARAINGTNFDGSANITTANWGTSRTLTIGNTGKSVNGSANVSWTLAEIGALPLTGGTVTGNISLQDNGVDANQTDNGVSSTRYPTTFNILDKNGHIIARQEAVVTSSGNIQSYWYVRNYDTSGNQIAQKGITMIMNKAGTMTYSVSDAANFRSAISAPSTTGSGASGSWGISITGNAATATKLQTARSLWGNNFDGTAAISGNITISHATNATMTADSTNPQITFSENGGQPVHLIYTDYDSYRNPAGLKVIGGASATPAWFEVEGSIYTGGNIYLNSTNGGLYKYYGAASTTPFLEVNSNNVDVSILKIDGDNPTTFRDSQAYGFNLKYIGTGAGAGNTLRLYGDNSNGTDQLAMEWSGDGKVGIGGVYDTNYKLIVRGTSYLNGATYINGTTTSYGPLRIGNADTAGTGTGQNGYAVANSGSNNYIAFYGVYGDNPGGYNHTYIGESIYGSKTTANEQSELLLFHGNDPGTGSGPDRIRLLAGQIDLCIYTAATSGTWDAIRSNAGTKVANFANGQVTITGNILPEATRTRNIGSGTAMWNDAHIARIGARHLDAASQSYTTDGQLHIGYGAVAPTKAIYLYDSADTSSRTKFFEVNSNGAYAPTRFGVNGQNTNYTLYVNGTTWHVDHIYIAAAKHIYMSYNSTNYNILHNHNNGNISLNAAGAGLYMAYQNTTFVNWMNGRMELRDGCLSIFPNTGGYREGIRIHATGSWSDITLCGNDNTGNSGISANSWFIGNNNGNFHITRNGSSGDGSAYLRCVNNVWAWNGTANGNISGNAATATKLGTATIGGANRGIYLNAGTATAVSWYPNSCTISGGNKANYPWHRFAYCTTGTGNYTDKSVIVILHSRYDGGPYGMVKLSMRTNSAGAAKSTSAVWIYRKGFAVDDIKISVPTETTGTDETISAYVKCGTYPRRIAFLLEGSNVGWTLVSSNEPNDTTASDKKGGTEINASVSGNNATDGATVAYATKLLNTPNNTTTFLRGDNTWTNTLGGSFTASGITSNQSIGIAQTGGASDYGISLYGGTGNVLNYGILFATTGHLGTHGMVSSDWATYFTMAGSQDRGWIFRSPTGGNVASISARGHIQVNGNIYIGSSRAGGYLNGGATNGGINSIMLGDDVWLGDCNAGGIMGMKSTGTNTGFYFYNSSGTQTGQLYCNGSQLYSNIEIRSQAANGFRLSNGNYGVILRNDGSHYYFLVTDSGSAATGGWNSLRPFYFNLTNGRVTMNNGASVGYANTSYTLSTSSFICNSWIRTVGSTGWYNESYGGGMYMTDSTWVRVYNSKGLHVDNTIEVAVNGYPSIRLQRTDSGEVSQYFINNTAGWAMGINPWGAGAGVFAIGQYAGTGSSTWRLKIDNNGYIFTSSYLNLGGGNEKNASSPPYVLGFNGSDNYVRSYQTAYLNVNSADYIHTYAANGNTNLECLQNVFDSIPKSVGTAIRLQHGSHSMALGWFLSGYSYANAYGGWLVSNYDDLSFCGVSNGSWRERHVWLQGDAVTGAVWNDYAEARTASGQPGQVVYELGDDTCVPTTERLSHFAGIVSDTWGFSQGETNNAKTHIAVAGRVLAYPYRDRNEYKPGDVLCAAPGGTVDIMTREEVIQYPDRIVGTVSCVPDYEEWGGGENADRPPVKVNGRIWVKVK